MAVPILRLNIDDNPRIIVKQDNPTIIVTGYTNTWGSITGTLSGQTDLWNELTGMTADIQSAQACCTGLTETFNTYTGDTFITLSGLTWAGILLQAQVNGLENAFESHTGDTTIHFPFSDVTDAIASATSGMTSSWSGLTGYPTDNNDLNAIITGLTADIQTNYECCTGNTADINYHYQQFTGFTDYVYTLIVPAITGNTADISYLSGQTDSAIQCCTGLTATFNDYTGDTFITLSGITVAGALLQAQTNNLQQAFTGHTGNTDIHFVMSAITITESQISDLGDYALQSDFTGHTSDLTIHYPQSGISITESQVTNLPTDLTYLQSQITGLAATQTSDRIYVFEHTASDIAGYETLTPIPTTITATTESVALTLAGGAVLIDSYASPQEGLGVVEIPAGVWTLHFHAYVSSLLAGRVTTLRFDAYKRTSGGTETLLQTGIPRTIDSTTVKEFQFSTSRIAYTGLTSTDRLVFKVYGQSNNTTTLYWSYGGTDINAFVQVPIKFSTAPLWSNVAAKPTWLSATTLSAFQTGHTHSYTNLTDLPDLNAYTLTGTTAALQSAFDTYTGTTAPNSFLPITGLTGYWTSAQTTGYVTGLNYITGYTVTADDITGITASLYAPIVHTHSYNDLTDLPTLFTGHTFVASGGTIISQTGDEVTIYSPTGATGASGLTPTLSFTGVSVVNYTQVGTAYTIGLQAASGITPTLSFVGSGDTIVDFTQTGTSYTIGVLAASGITPTLVFSGGSTGTTVDYTQVGATYYIAITGQTGAQGIQGGAGSGATILISSGATIATYISGSTTGNTWNVYSPDYNYVNIKSITGTSYTTIAGDSNKILECASGCTGMTLHSGATTGFQLTIVSLGAQTITFTAQSGSTLRSKDSAVTLVNQYGAVTAYKNNTYWTLIGDLS